MDWSVILGSIISNAIFVAIAAGIINHLLSRKLDDYRYTKLQRQKAEIVAQLLAKWGKYRGNEDKILTKTELYDYYEELNALSYQAILWLDIDLLDEIETAFMNASGIDPLLRHTREKVLGKQKAGKPKVLALWPNDRVSRQLFPHLYNNAPKPKQKH